MGTSNIRYFEGDEDRADFGNQLLKEVGILQDLIDSGSVESGVMRLGAELEIFIVNEDGSASDIAPKVLEKLPDSFTSEYSDFIVELNINPHEFLDSSIDEICSEIKTNLNLLKGVLEGFGKRYVLCGILPSFNSNDLSVDVLTEERRYSLLHNFVHSKRNNNHEVQIDGIESLDEKDGLDTYVGAVASYQMHAQIEPSRAIELLNISQILTPAIMAISTNSPIFKQKALWHETRVPLFGQGADHRNLHEKGLGEKPRVFFGEDWYEGSVKDVFVREFADYGLWLGTDISEQTETKIPELETLLFQNGLIYRWNRLCYGVYDGRATLRIENRYVSAGPTIDDNLDVQLLWSLLMYSEGSYLKEQVSKTDFWRVKESFTKAAKNGIATEIYWDGSNQPVVDVVCNILIPLAVQTAKALQMESLLSRLERLSIRVAGKKTGSIWQLERFFEPNLPLSLRTKAITRTMSENQYQGLELNGWADECMSLSPNTADDIAGLEPLRVELNSPISYVLAMCEMVDKHFIAVFDRNDNQEFVLRYIDLVNIEVEKLEGLKTLSIKSVDQKTPIDRVRELLDKHDELVVMRDGATLKVIGGLLK